MNASKYHIFCRVVDLGSFTGAAAELGYTQSAVSQIVRALEQELGTVLLERRRDGLRLTSDGLQYMPFLRNLSAAEQALEQKQREMDGLESSTILIDTFTSVSRNILPPLMRAFRRQYPGVDFVLRQGEYTSIRDDLLAGRVDLGFISPGMNAPGAEHGMEHGAVQQPEFPAALRREHGAEHAVSRQSEHETKPLAKHGQGHVPSHQAEPQFNASLNPVDFSGLELTKLYDDDMVAVLPPEHPLADTPHLSLDDLSRETFILLDEGADYNTALEGFRMAGLTPSIGYEVYDDYTIMSMIRQGLGVSLLFRRVVRGFSEGVEIRELDTPLTRPVYLAWKNRDTLPIAARRFADYILAHVDEVQR